MVVFIQGNVFEAQSFALKTITGRFLLKNCEGMEGDVHENDCFEWGKRVQSSKLHSKTDHQGPRSLAESSDSGPHSAVRKIVAKSSERISLRAPLLGMCETEELTIQEIHKPMMFKQYMIPVKATDHEQRNVCTKQQLSRRGIEVLPTTMFTNSQI